MFARSHECLLMDCLVPSLVCRILRGGGARRQASNNNAVESCDYPERGVPHGLALFRRETMLPSG